MWTPLTINGRRHLAEAAALARPSYSFLAPFVRPNDTSSIRSDATGPCKSSNSDVKYSDKSDQIAISQWQYFLGN